jgi:hypothetical protein
MNSQPVPTYILWERSPQPTFTDRLLSLYRASGKPA